ncbi:lytic transglycosylase domain-containing protein [Telmatospirillum sp. J64-1]|uniref:lytic transglycosylase domain-containing protein n=1 Tax=Telmatospirillum sp. J64-1 TaxID=2502183 RepID=UPI00115D71A0|nr:lytic transglycosylase domain-containing protein [Telmatospirillum sp. J64-1]
MRTTAAAFIVAAALFAVPAASHAALLSPEDGKLYAQALSLAQEGKFDEANKVAAQAKDKLLAKVVRWQELIRPRSGATFADITAFIDANPDWPQMGTMQRRAEEAITVATPDSQILAWFADRKPLTVDGRMALAKAYLNSGQKEKAVEVARDAWINGTFGVLQERNFASTFGNLLTHDDHWARLDRLLWDRDIDAAKRMVPRVNASYKKLAEARFGLIAMAGNVNGLIAQVPKELQNDPGLVYERLRWRRQKDLTDTAIELLSHPSRNQVRPDRWWTERAILARRSLREGNISVAYNIAKDHGQTEGVGFADAEWLSGWIALRFLQEPEKAFDHFKRLYEGVSFPVSRARGAYWTGRAAEAMGKKEQAAEWYSRAAEHITTYYGQLAAGRLGKDRQWVLPADPLPSAEDIEAFDKNELTRVARMLGEVGMVDAVQPFLTRLNDSMTTPGQRALVTSLANSLNRPDWAVNLAKRSDRDGIPLIGSAFPIPPLKTVDKPERALVLGLIRQESGFHHGAVSSAGAMGLMQVLPSTARQVAKSLGIDFNPSHLTGDPDLNVQIGSAYLENLLQSFNGSYVLALAAYNAGPSRAREWLQEYGDPRSPDVDAVDWVESIPFYETRNYIQRVLESVQVYRSRLGETGFVHSLEGDLKR